MRFFVIVLCIVLCIVPCLLAVGACPATPREGAGEGEGEGEGEKEGEGALCTFNADCPTSLRCGCDEGTCACEVGPRGTGRNGVDVCDDEDDCDTALCVEDSAGSYTCSGPCVDEEDCGPRLPVCADIAFVGRVCIRIPP